MIDCNTVIFSGLGCGVYGLGLGIPCHSATSVKHLLGCKHASFQKPAAPLVLQVLALETRVIRTTHLHATYCSCAFCWAGGLKYVGIVVSPGWATLLAPFLAGWNDVPEAWVVACGHYGKYFSISCCIVDPSWKWLQQDGPSPCLLFYQPTTLQKSFRHMLL